MSSTEADDTIGQATSFDMTLYKTFAHCTLLWCATGARVHELDAIAPLLLLPDRADYFDRYRGASIHDYDAAHSAWLALFCEWVGAVERAATKERVGRHKIDIKATLSALLRQHLTELLPQTHAAYLEKLSASLERIKETGDEAMARTCLEHAGSVTVATSNLPHLELVTLRHLDILVNEVLREWRVEEVVTVASS